MAKFKALWKKHVGQGYVCDSTVFVNQCAMRMGQALADQGIHLASYTLRTCVQYNRRKFAGHAPGHVRSAQQLADLFSRKPELLGGGTKRERWKGTIDKNLDNLRNRTGMIFIKNGWGTTDHIDLWDGRIEQLRGGEKSYFNKGEAVWFWEIGD